jgi:branched-chain amino acid aminotransferase group I
MKEHIYLNGGIVSSAEARVSVFDHGYLYGYGVFETMRAYSGHIFRIDQHLERLHRGLSFLGIPEPKIALDLACHATLQANHLDNARLRMEVTAGAGEPSPDPLTCRHPTVVAFARPLDLAPESYESGFHVVLSSFTRNSTSLLTQVKSVCYSESILARQEAKKAGADEAILCNERGFLADGATTNIFLVKDGSITTPPTKSGALPGITRAVVLELANACGIQTSEVALTMDDLINADEAFLTNTVIELMPIRFFQGKVVGKESRGMVTRRLMTAYRNLVRKETTP